jgi:hypothetical protein
VWEKKRRWKLVESWQEVIIVIGEHPLARMRLAKGAAFNDPAPYELKLREVLHTGSWKNL